ncbi:IclR family transcriptional regulator [Streptomyces sp. NPDC004542]|uniref:IclR family transcriptional regulator n=1 Tax=Streptomyces sp. NPDC004542 TaxID=3154281 RepID=UPI0033BF1A8E
MHDTGADDGEGSSGAPERGGPSVLGRAFLLLDVLGRAGGPLGLSEIAAASGIPKATTFRLLGQLVHERAVVRKGEMYAPGMRLFALGSAVRVPQRLRDAALPVMSELSAAAGPVVHLGVLDGHTALQVQRLAGGPHQAPSVPRGPAPRRPLHATALGKALLAQLPDERLDAFLTARTLEAVTRFTATDPARLRREVLTIRHHGVSSERDEWRVGFCAVGAPIGTLADDVVAAIAVAGRRRTFDADRSAGAVRAAAERIARSTGATAAPRRETTGSPIGCGGRDPSPPR